MLLNLLRQIARMTRPVSACTYLNYSLPGRIVSFEFETKQSSPQTGMEASAPCPHTPASSAPCVAGARSTI